MRRPGVLGVVVAIGAVAIVMFLATRNVGSTPEERERCEVIIQLSGFPKPTMQQCVEDLHERARFDANRREVEKR